MNSRQFANLACKILGIFMLMHGIILLSNLFCYLFVMPSDDNALNVWNMGVGLTIVIFGILIYFFSNNIAAIMVKTDKSTNILSKESQITAYDIQRIAFSVLGLYFIGNSLPEISTLILYLFSFPDTIADIYLKNGSSVIQFVIGILIFLGSNKLTHFSINAGNKLK